MNKGTSPCAEDGCFMSNNYPDIIENAQKVLEKRYFWRDAQGNLIEKTVDDLFNRVASVVGSAENLFTKNPDYPHTVTAAAAAAKAFEMQRSLRFIFNTPTLTNAGRKRGQLAACYVLPISDSMEGIMDTLKGQALVQKSGGGTGFGFGKIRERGCIIESTGQRAAGPVPIIKLMNYMMSEFIIQGGVRYGANMGVLPISHPSIYEFITFKREDGSCKSFNISPALTDEFMRAVLDNDYFELVSPHSGEVVQKIKARELFDEITQLAWETGDPGALFIDTANKFNPTPQLGRLEATNPCGEQWLLPNEACTLGHCNLSMYYKMHPDMLSGNPAKWEWEKNIDWDQYAEDIKWGIRFLDNVIEVNYYALPEIERMHKHTNRKIGLGVLGLADLLIKLGIPYDSEKARSVADAIAKFHQTHADKASCELGKERGSFGAFVGSAVQAAGWEAMRNACRTTVAPTGSTAIICNAASTGIESIFGLILKREQAGMVMYETHGLFNEYADLMEPTDKAAMYEYYFEHNTIKGCPVVKPEIQALFAQANDISLEGHVLMQATWQKYIDNSISKTINLPNSATVEDVRKAYIMAWETGCKGITIFRDGCRSSQPLSHVTSTKAPEAHSQPLVAASDEYVESDDTLCPECQAKMEIAGGCEACKECGYSVCKI
jgi:ribonucleoside-diphosphate reductase alpha chain